MIKIKNMRKDVRKDIWDVRVDRTSVLGNPYRMRMDVNGEERPGTRDEVCEMYDNAFNSLVTQRHPVIMAELDRLYEIYCRYGKLNLFCWCAPDRCHAETIKHYLERRKADDTTI